MKGDKEQIYTVGHEKKLLRRFANRNVENSAAYLARHLKRCMKVLDVGCGEGSITAGFAKICLDGEVVGIDIKAEVVESASEKHATHANLTFDKGNAMQLAFPDDHFDVVHAHQVLQYVPGAADVMAEMKRVTKPGGIVAVSVACCEQMLAAPDHEAMMGFMRVLMTGIELGKGDPRVAGKLPEIARTAGFSTVHASSSVMFFSEKEERDSVVDMWEGALTNPAMKQVLKVAGKDGEADITKIKRTLDELRTCDHGLFMIPNIEILCFK